MLVIHAYNYSFKKQPQILLSCKKLLKGNKFLVNDYMKMLIVALKRYSINHITFEIVFYNGCPVRSGYDTLFSPK